MLELHDFVLSHHALHDLRVAAGEGLDLCHGEYGFTDIIHFADIRLTGQELLNELCFRLKDLPDVRIKATFDDVHEGEDFGIHIALANEATFALL